MGILLNVNMAHVKQRTDSISFLARFHSVREEGGRLLVTDHSPAVLFLWGHLKICIEMALYVLIFSPISIML